MKFYITQETKQEIEDKIAELNDEEWSPYRDGELHSYEKILSSSTIFPVEESWVKVAKKHGVSSILSEFYPNGVIIQPK